MQTSLPAPSPRSDPGALLLDVCERVAILLAVSLFYGANYASHRALNLLVVASDALTVWFILFRRPATSLSRRGEDWLAAFVGTFAVMFMRPGGDPLLPPSLAAGLVISGIGLTIWAKLSLNQSFGLAPANRGVRVTGAYALVRHPMYASYVIVHTTYVLINPTPFNAGLLLLSLAGQIARVFFEERLLRDDPAYAHYARQVRFRLLPGLF